MSTDENKFIRQLKLVLIGILGPFIIAGVLNAIVMIPNVKANKESIELVKEQYVTNDMMIRYVDEFRRANETLGKALDTRENKDIEEFARINKRMDDLIKEMYPYKTRGAVKN